MSLHIQVTTNASEITEAQHPDSIDRKRLLLAAASAHHALMSVGFTLSCMKRDPHVPPQVRAQYQRLETMLANSWEFQTGPALGDDVCAAIEGAVVSAIAQPRTQVLDALGRNTQRAAQTTLAIRVVEKEEEPHEPAP